MRIDLNNVLLVEDNNGDARLVIEAFKSSKFDCKIHRVHNGVEGLDFLRKKGEFKDSPRPNIVLLDLDMPQMDGREFLKILKADINLESIPVVVMTTSDAQEDEAIVYNNKANCFIRKPVDLERLMIHLEFVEK